MLSTELVHNELAIIIIIRRQNGFNLSFYCHKKKELRKFIICPMRIYRTDEPYKRLSNTKNKNNCLKDQRNSRSVGPRLLPWQEERKYNGN